MPLSMQERTKQFIELQKIELDLQDKKGQDYGEDQNGLKNLERRGVQGVLMRMGDKMSRLESLLAPDRIAQVSDESVDDTCLDLSNYCKLLIILRRQIAKDAQKGQKKI